LAGRTTSVDSKGLVFTKIVHDERVSQVLHTKELGRIGARSKKRQHGGWRYKAEAMYYSTSMVPREQL
jgi:hypothetical protein